MKKSLFICFVCSALVCAFALPNLLAVDAPADGLKMDHFKAEKNNMVVTFNHATHASIACESCHHMWDGSSAVQSCADGGCHDVMDKKDKSAHSYYKAIHDRKGGDVGSCISCHSEEAKKKKGDRDYKKMMTSCKGSACHP